MGQLSQREALLGGTSEIRQTVTPGEINVVHESLIDAAKVFYRLPI
jgi:hypothetical protein